MVTGTGGFLIMTTDGSGLSNTCRESLEHASRRLAYLLRHDCKYNYETGGWRPVSDLVEKFSFTKELIERIVYEDAKGRFELNEDKSKVRALYGHSVNVDLSLTPVNPPEYLYHGTAVKYIASIQDCGLKPKSRQFVHLTEDVNSAIKTGLRHGVPVLLKVSSRKMSLDGYQFFRLSNGVWLTKEVDVKYIEIKKVTS